MESKTDQYELISDILWNLNNIKYDRCTVINYIAHKNNLENDFLRALNLKLEEWYKKHNKYKNKSAVSVIRHLFDDKIRVINSLLNNLLELLKKYKINSKKEMASLIINIYVTQDDKNLENWIKSTLLLETIKSCLGIYPRHFLIKLRNIFSKIYFTITGLHKYTFIDIAYTNKIDSIVFLKYDIKTKKRY